MKVTTDKIEGSRVVLNVEVDADEMEKAVQQAYRRLGAKASIPGFRKGKAPPVVVEQYLGKAALIEDAAEHLLPQVYDRAIQENDVDAIAQPEVEILQVDPLAFKATVPVRPTVELGDYSQMRFDPDPVEVTDEEVTEVVERLRSLQAPWEPVERPAMVGDLLAIDVAGTIEDETVIDEKERWYELSHDLPSALPGFSQQMEGAEKGEERTFTLMIPEERGEYGGKECCFRVVVNDVKQKMLPELDDEFAKNFGQGVQTLEALREKLAADLRTRKEAEARSAVEDKAIQALVDAATIEYPEVMVDSQVEHLISQQKEEFGDQQGLENYLKSVGKTEEELRSDMRPVAERMVLRSLVIQKFAEMEKIEVGGAEIETEVENIRQRASGEGVGKLFQSPAARESLGRNIFIKKAMDRLYQVATGGGDSAVSDEAPGEETVASPENEGEDDNADAA
jgi:trigger factor